MSRLAVTMGMVVATGGAAACAPVAGPSLAPPAARAAPAAPAAPAGLAAPAAPAALAVEPDFATSSAPLIANRVDGYGDAGGALDVPVVAEVRPPSAGDLGDLTGAPLIATLDTSLGVIHCHLRGDRTPATVAGFVGLATGAKAWASPGGDVLRGVRFYDGLEFHRVIPGFMIQGGDPLGLGVGGPGYEFADELVDDLRHDGPGVLSMANAGPDTNGSQFFITDGPAPWLDGKHTVFGRCDEVDVIDRIARVPTSNRDRPLQPVVIRSLTITRG